MLRIPVCWKRERSHTEVSSFVCEFVVCRGLGTVDAVWGTVIKKDFTRWCECVCGVCDDYVRVWACAGWGVVVGVFVMNVMLVRVILLYIEIQ